MNLTCDDARSLVPGYLDGELGEAQASPLRGHLMACPSCREAAMEGRTIKRWLQAGRPDPLPVPSDFAARVARRALAGDPGLCDPDELPALRPRRSLTPFLMALSAAAAVLLFGLAVSIRGHSLPDSNGLEAREPARPPWLQATEAPADAAQRPAPRQPREEDELGPVGPHTIPVRR